MLQAGAPDRALAERLERSYYALTATTQRHFSRPGRGWFLTGVAGLDAPTMNRAVVEDADAVEVGNLVREAEAFFGERECAWSVVLSSFRDPRAWHSELVARGLSPSSTLDVLARAPGPLEGPVPPAEVRAVKPAEVPLFTDLIMEVFRMPRRFYPALLDMTDAWRRAGARLYFAELDGEPAATALVADLDGVAGIYNVGTLRHARRLGLARALMARCLEDSRDAEVVTLQVAPEGFVEPFYLALGFEPAYRWRFYSPRVR
ncbi:MAG TPA: GNAT family N-acetyltransferase [Candidatus Thermoplasmatota archaeon]|nr:GNAT family N-acetyltransferase [Candidatus Thermoplasmatota archaeon]